MNSEKLQGKDVCSVIVTYHPDPGLCNRITHLRDQVGKVVVVDNNSGSADLRALGQLPLELGIHLIFNNENLGIGTALNQGVQWAQRQGYTWVLTLDQDSVVASDMISTLVSVHGEFPERQKLAIIGSNYKDPNSDRMFLDLCRNSEPRWREVKTVITSGSLLSLAAYSTIGSFREEFFMDCIDLEYCLRARSRGFKIVLACRPLMQHTIGATSMHRLPWKSTGTSNHSPVRRYYMTRNHIALVREYLRSEPKWALATLYSRLKSTILMCLFEGNRFRKLSYTAIGVLDGLLSNFHRNVSRLNTKA